MDPNDSEFLRIAVDYVNSKITRGEIVDYDEARTALTKSYMHILENPQIFIPAWHEQSKRTVCSITADRKKYGKKVERNLLKRYAAAFNALDEALAAAELANRAMNAAFRLWLHEAPREETYQKLFGIESVLGGHATRFLLLMGMHARMVVISSEISLLLRKGYTDGAFSRIRTLYELVVKAFFLCTREPTPGGYELAERYYVSSLVERLKEGGDSDLDDEVSQEMISEARKRWGDNFFKGENNWAAPGTLNPASKRVTFKDIEDAVEGEAIRHVYLACNAAVHAGSLTVIGSADLHRSYFYNNRSSVDLSATAYIGSTITFFLLMGSVEVLRCLTTSMREWDCALIAAAIFPCLNAAADLFNEQQERLGEEDSCEDE
ncbi:DUF5677 domain-containing protein [Microbispora sp. CA-135349]|uniref:DUF5677 domain-containing protein n=1 Tax=Microbispora sp. CA-135349 TaxID=3239953 RepID=UPI003D90CB43